MSDSSACRASGSVANIVGEPPIALEAGQVIVFTRGDPHIMSSRPGMRADPHAPRALDTLGQFIRLAMIESADQRAGGDSVLAKMSELMFIEVVRRHLEALPPDQAGWLAGLRDPFVGRALSLMHRDPGWNWTIEELARDVGVARSVLAERFADLVGVPPMQYLAKWRMQIASELLAGGSANIATVATTIGYGSEAAFSRVFKKMVGMPPSAWRRRLRPPRLLDLHDGPAIYCRSAPRTPPVRGQD